MSEAAPHLGCWALCTMVEAKMEKCWLIRHTLSLKYLEIIYANKFFEGVNVFYNNKEMQLKIQTNVENFASKV